MRARTIAGTAVFAALACGPEAGITTAGESETGTTSTGSTSTAPTTGDDVTEGGGTEAGEPDNPIVLCPFELSPLESLPREPELRFTTEQLAFTGPMTWHDGALLVAIALDIAGSPRKWGVGATVDATSELSLVWELPPENYPQALVSTPGGVLVVADSWHSDFTGGLLRLRPDGGHDILGETPYSGLGIDAAHPLAVTGGEIFARMTDTPSGYAGRPGRLPAGGGAIETFDFQTILYAVSGGAFIGLDVNRGALPCMPDCLPPLASLTLARHDIALQQTTTIATPICITGNDDYVPSVTGGRTVRGVHVGAAGLVIDEGALVEIGFDGSHRVIAAVEDGIDGAVEHDGSLYFVSGETPAGRDPLALRRVRSTGGVVEEWLRLEDSRELTVAAFSDAHIYIVHEDLERRAVLRVPQ